MKMKKKVQVFCLSAEFSTFYKRKCRIFNFPKKVQRFALLLESAKFLLYKI